MTFHESIFMNIKLGLWKFESSNGLLPNTSNPVPESIFTDNTTSPEVF